MSNNPALANGAKVFRACELNMTRTSAAITSVSQPTIERDAAANTNAKGRTLVITDPA
jgi:hypothetical protein